jgi:HEAT repeat protein
MSQVIEITSAGQSRRVTTDNSVLVCYDAQGNSSAQYLQSQPRLELVATPETTALPWLHYSIAGVASQVTPTTSSTTPAMDREAENRFLAALQRGEEERFEDGMESGFSNELESLVRQYGSRSRDILSRLLENDNLSVNVWAEAMRCLGRIDDLASREARLWVLEKGLTARSAIVRDGAALGIASMDDPSAIPYLERAIASETVRELRTDMLDVLGQLTNER